MKKLLESIFLLSFIFMYSCHNYKTEKIEKKQDSIESFVDTILNDSLLILKPNYSRIDLVCGKMPQKSDTSVILIAEAAYTGELLEEFNHSNIAGDHVSGGKRENGYSCIRNTGAFVFYNGKWKFSYDSYSDDLDLAAQNGGAGFAQELIMFNGSQKKTVREDSNRNQFRSLCELNGHLCIIESKDSLSFGEYRRALQSCGVKNAIYLDMGGGWNYAWYRTNKKEIKVLHEHTHDYCTNWITFYL